MKKLFFVLLLISCTGQSVVNLGPVEVKELLENDDLFVLNVHTPYEGKLDKTDAFIEDWENIASHVDVLPADKGAPILVYCRSGRMSSSAVKQLQELGYSNLYHLDGGMIAWDAAGFPVIEKSWD